MCIRVCIGIVCIYVCILFIIYYTSKMADKSEIPTEEVFILLSIFFFLFHFILFRSVSFHSVPSSSNFSFLLSLLFLTLLLCTVIASTIAFSRTISLTWRGEISIVLARFDSSRFFLRIFRRIPIVENEKRRKFQTKSLVVEGFQINCDKEQEEDLS